MKDLELYDVLDYILNRADSSELVAVRAALRKRESSERNDPGRPPGGGALGMDVRRVASSTAEEIQTRIGASRDEIRGMVARMVRRVLRREAPELSEEQIRELLDEWIPGGTEDRPAARSPPDASPDGPSERDETTRATVAPSADGSSRSELPAEALLAMIRQFVEYSLGSMAVREEMDLVEQIPDWQRRYWEAFPQVVRRLISLLIKGTIGGDEFWEGIDDALELKE